MISESNTDQSDYLDIYQLAVEMADRTSARRLAANSFFIAANAALLAFPQDMGWRISAAGIVLCLAWWAMLRSYRNLNAAKFEVICILENALPAQIFTDEWKILQQGNLPLGVHPKNLGKWIGRYKELGFVERLVPLLFLAIYILALSGI